MITTKSTAAISAFLLAILLLPAAALADQASAPPIDLVTLPSPGSPIIALELMIRAGSMDDPAGKEGLAALTGLMVADAGTRQRSYSELLDALYPMASEIDVVTDRELTVISGTVHREKLSEYTKLLLEVALEPGFKQSDFDRNREQLTSYLTNTLRASNDELLGLEVIQQVIFAGHPYAHAPEGTVAGLASITLDDVRSFYRRHYTRSGITVGVAGGYPTGFPESLAAGLAALPVGTVPERSLPSPSKIEGRQFTLVEKETDSVGIHFGYALNLNRSDPDYYPLMVANSFLGEHRTSHGRLMQQLREERGFNYGDYSYIEYWYQPPFTNTPAPGVARRQQYFSVWLRPVVPATAHFALRNALFEVDRLISTGLSEEEFELTRDFLVNYSKLWAQTLSVRLGFLMDSHYLDMPYYIDEIASRLKSMTRDQVNAAAKKYLQSKNFAAVAVTANAAAFAEALRADQPSPMTYAAKKPEAILAADKVIEKIPVAPKSISILSVDQAFQK